MCGITGIWSKDRIDCDAYYNAHLQIRHRGPDDEGFMFLHEREIKLAKGDDTIPAFHELPHIKSIEHSNLILGHRRLSILDLSEKGHQPMVFEHLSIIFNGEIFNFKDIRTELIALGYHFISNTDTEVVLKGYHCWGENLWNKLNGMWACAIYDTSKLRLILCRDRFGIKPLYFKLENNRLTFASELKFFTFKSYLTINHSVLNKYLNTGNINESEQTSWEEVNELEPGTFLIFENQKIIRKGRYWNYQPNLIRRTHSQALEEFQYLFEDSLRLRMISDVEVGTLLSGGLDSTTIVCGLKNIGIISNDFQSFSAVFEEKEFSEDTYIKDTLQHTGINGHFINPRAEEFGSYIDKLIYSHEEPFRSLAIYSQYKIYEYINKNTKVKVVLNGQGSDECYGGYSTHYAPLFSHYLKNFKFNLMAKEFAALKPNSNYISSLKFKYKVLTGIFNNFSFENAFNIQSYSQIKTSPLREYLRYDDRNSMAFGVEARVPFLDYRLVEFAFSLEEKYKIDNGISKKIVRDYGKDVIPQSVLNRKDKMGFTSPQQVWQTGLLKETFDSAFLEIKKDGLLGMNGKDIYSKYLDYQNKKSDDWFYIWRNYMVYKWLKFNKR